MSKLARGASWLFLGSLAWGLMMYSAFSGPPSSVVEGLGGALGIGGLVFAVGAVPAGIAYVTTRSQTKTLWVWVVAVLVLVAFMAIGAARLTRPSVAASLPHFEKKEVFTNDHAA